MTAFLEIIDHILSWFGGVILVYGSCKAFILFVHRGLGLQQEDRRHFLDEIRLGLGRHIVLGLEFLIVADILSTIIRPGWNEVGLLAVIVVIRTVLAYFLTRELHQIESHRRAHHPKQ